MELIETLSLAHYGIVAAFIDRLGIVDFLDRHLPKTHSHSVSSGQLAKAVILNGLGFVERRLYLFPEFFENLPTERLIGPGVKPEHLNDDAVGRLLDGLSEYNISLLYERFVLECLAPFLHRRPVLHGDTTNFSVHGEYVPDEGFKWEVTFGHPKDGRTDLKRFVLNMVTNGSGIPLFLELLSGNASDSKSIVAGLEKATRTLAALGESPLYSIADAAFYSAENIARVEGSWISRVPATLNEAAALLETDEPLAPCSDPRYTFLEKTSRYGGVEQRWFLIRSDEMAAKQERTLAKRMERTLGDAKKDASRLSRTEFFCEADARSAADAFLSDHPLLKKGSVNILETRRRKGGGRGRPAAGEELEKRYHAEIDLDLAPDAIEALRRKLGRFILATSAVGEGSPSASEILSLYKEQCAVEKGFRFLKDKSFHTSEIYLKREERIEGLMLLMTIALAIYNLAEEELREVLSKNGESIPDPNRRPMKKPTVRRLFQIFSRVSITILEESGRRIAQVMNLNETHKRVLSLLGERFEQYYIDSPLTPVDG